MAGWVLTLSNDGSLFAADEVVVEGEGFGITMATIDGTDGDLIRAAVEVVTCR